MPSRRHYIGNPRVDAAGCSAKRAAPCDGCPIGRVVASNPAGDEELQALVRIADQLSFTRGQHVLTEGDPANHWFLISDGVVTLDKLLPDGRRQVTGFLARGGVLGITADGHYAHSAHAVTEVRVCRFAWRQFDPLIDRLPALRRALLSFARHELAAAQDHMLLLGRMTAEERIASFLLRIAKLVGETNSPSERLPMNRVEIADYLGLTQETLSRILSTWRREGLIQTDLKGTVRICDRRRLAQLAEQSFD